ncbi:MAG: GNAT N-acetyltransferase [Bacteroidales bacterium]|nr:GNAT N-acetyltransferase [Bacteroidales bacterium]
MNIKLRQWSMGDIHSLANLFNTYDRSYTDFNFPEAGKYSMGDVISCIRNFVDMSLNGWGYACAITLNDKVVGHVQITKRADIYDANCELLICLTPSACGCGVGSEAVRLMTRHAFVEENYEGLFITMLDTNTAARRMAEKAGLQYCGIDDSWAWHFRGKPCTRVMYFIRRPRMETANSGVEIRPWECRDIDALAYLYNTVDRRYVDIEDINAENRQHFIEDNHCEPEPSWLHTRMLYRVRSYVDRWNVYEQHGGDIFRAIVSDGDIVGLVSLSVKYGKRAVDGVLGYMVMPEHCGKGVASKAVALMLDEVFGKHSLNRVTAMVYAPNKASSRVLEKNGFKLEGVQREAVMCEGKPVDYLCYGLLRKEQAQNNK